MSFRRCACCRGWTIGPDDPWCPVCGWWVDDVASHHPISLQKARAEWLAVASTAVDEYPEYAQARAKEYSQALAKRLAGRGVSEHEAAS